MTKVGGLKRIRWEDNGVSRLWTLSVWPSQSHRDYYLHNKPPKHERSLDYWLLWTCWRCGDSWSRLWIIPDKKWVHGEDVGVSCMSTPLSCGGGHHCIKSGCVYVSHVAVPSDNNIIHIFVKLRRTMLTAIDTPRAVIAPDRCHKYTEGPTTRNLTRLQYLTRHASKHRVHQLHQSYLPKETQSLSKTVQSHRPFINYPNVWQCSKVNCVHSQWPAEQTRIVASAVITYGLIGQDQELYNDDIGL